jgi:hypothetical protein
VGSDTRTGSIPVCGRLLYASILRKELKHFSFYREFLYAT